MVAIRGGLDFGLGDPGAGAGRDVSFTNKKSAFAEPETLKECKIYKGFEIKGLGFPPARFARRIRHIKKCIVS